MENISVLPGALPSTSTPKKRRKPNWTVDETFLLANLINERKHIIKGKFGPNLCSADKKRAWVEVARAITASYPNTVRSAEDCERRWFVTLSKSRRAIAANKKEFIATGGGPPTEPPLDPVDEKVKDIIGDKNVSLLGVPSLDYDVFTHNDLEGDHTPLAESSLVTATEEAILYVDDPPQLVQPPFTPQPQPAASPQLVRTRPAISTQVVQPRPTVSPQEMPMSEEEFLQKKRALELKILGQQLKAWGAMENAMGKMASYFERKPM